MDILWQILQWIAAVGEIFLGYYAVEVFTKRGMLREYKKYFTIWGIMIASLLAYNRHWDLGLLSWFMLILQNILMIFSVDRKFKMNRMFSISVIITYNVCNALLQLLFNFVMLTWSSNGDIQMIYGDLGIYRVSCYYLAVLVEWGILYILSKRIHGGMKIESYYKSILLYGTAGIFLIIALQSELLAYGKARSSRYAFLLQIVLLVSLFILLGSIKSIETKAKLQLLDTHNKMLESNYREMKRIYQKYAFTFHDMKNHLVVLDQYCRNGENENAISYIEKIRGPIMQNYHFINSGNESMDIIINFKLLEARQAGIKTEIVADQINDVRIEDYDLCCIIGNLFDNAIEACELVEKEKAWISVGIHLTGEILLIHISNSCSEKEGGCTNIPLKKKALQGYGMQSVKSVVEKYEGLFKWEKKEDVFSAKVTIFNAKGTS